jgi:hypothetical protein
VQWDGRVKGYIHLHPCKGFSQILFGAFICKISNPHAVCIGGRRLDGGFELGCCRVCHGGTRASTEGKGEGGWEERESVEEQWFVCGRTTGRTRFLAMKQRRGKFSRLLQHRKFVTFEVDRARSSMYVLSSGSCSTHGHESTARGYWPIGQPADRQPTNAEPRITARWRSL